MTDKAVRPFSAEVQYPDKKPFRVGTFFAPAKATDNERDRLVLDEVRKFWGDHFPENVPPPKVIKTDWGYTMFVPEEEGWP